MRTHGIAEAKLQASDRRAAQLFFSSNISRLLMPHRYE
jgi:hypothetical protein